MADITVGGKGFEGVIATFNTSCVTNIKITPTVDWIDFTIETNTVNTRVEAYTGDNPRQQSFTLSFTALTENNDGSESEKACTKDFSIEQLSKNFHPEEGGEDPPTPPTPEVCTKFIVDGGHLNAEKEGKVGCDSAYLYGNPTAVYSPSTASSWVHISYVYYYEDPSHCCTDYESFPEVAYDMQDEAGVPRDLNDHNLGTVWYTVDPNGDDEDRSCEVWFIVDDVECTSKKYVITQSGGGGGGGCEMSITISGLPSGEKAKVTWGSEGDEQLGNGTHSHTSTHSSLNVSVTKEGWSFNPSSASLSCGGTTSASFTGSEGCNGCDSSLVLTPSEITADPAGGTYTIEYTCCKELVLEGRYTDGMCTFTQTYNSSTQKGVVTVVCVGNDTQNSKTGYVLFKNDHASTECAKTKITQDKKGDIPESWIINLRIANTTSDYACIDSVEIFIDGFSTSLQTDLGECVNAGGEENLGSVTLPNAASAPEGSTITRIEAVVSDGTGTPGVIKTLTTNNSTLTNGGNYKFTYNG